MIKNESLIDSPNNTGPRVPVEKHAIVAFIVSLERGKGEFSEGNQEKRLKKASDSP